MQNVLLTGFEPFDKAAVNPSWEAVRQLDGVQLCEGVQMVARCLPCAFATAAETLLQLINELRPAMVIATGLGLGAVIFPSSALRSTLTMRVFPTIWGRSRLILR